ncbi:hypothetical protein V6N11_072385 [Hibiscus sabdariffa]|uniref:RNase H type-1 domain-containing protein n=1 Tax=Hibiscus sabdariffa TaxID=183260 RepID=A0ABR2U2X9_9ROSI
MAASVSAALGFARVSDLGVYLAPAAIVDANLLVRDVVLDNGDWNWVLLRNLLQAPAIPHILNLSAPTSHVGSDRCCWFGGKSGAFSVKSAYIQLAQDDWDIKDAKWKMLWGLHVPERIKYFLWLSFHGRILTNENRCIRHLCEDPVCSICASSDESILHVLRDCRSTATLWSSIVPRQQLREFFHLEIADWILYNLNSRCLLKGSNIPWNIFFAVLVWQIWKLRNSIVFSDVDIPNMVLLSHCRSWSYHIISTIPMPLHGPRFALPENIQWQPASSDFCTLNVDGAVALPSSMGTAGGLIRNNAGDWIVGFNKFVGISSPLQAELWSAYEGLRLAWSYDFERVQLQSDCAEAVALLSSPLLELHDLSLARAIACLLQRSWVVDFVQIRREANFVADSLAKLTTNSDGSMRIFCDPPPLCISALDRDLYDPSYVRS